MNAVNQLDREFIARVCQAGVVSSETAERIVASYNACVGYTTEKLDEIGNDGGLAVYIGGELRSDKDELTAERDALAARVKVLEEALAPYADTDARHGCDHGPHSFNDYCGCECWACDCHHAGAKRALAKPQEAV